MTIKNVFSVTLGVMLLIFSSLSLAASVISLSEGDSQEIRLSSDMASVFIADPEVADYQVIDSKKLVVFAKKKGHTSLRVFDSQGKTLRSHSIDVNTNYTDVQRQISVSYPHADVVLSNIGDKIVLSGTVSSEQESDGVYRLVGELVGITAKTTELSWEPDDDDAYEMAYMQRREYPGIVNQLDVITTKQVNVKLSIAEVSSSFSEDFGLKFGAKTAGTFQNPLNGFSSDNIINLIAAINNDRVGKILSEPNLSVISGESASFLIGGELPVVTVVDGSTNVQYKEFGVRLELLAKVLRDDKIRLSIMPEVSSLDKTYVSKGYNLPALKTRKAKTTVELGDGQSFLLGGLLSTEERESLMKIPFIGDIPVLGSLFRYTETERIKTELVIIATVNLVQPIESGEVVLPGLQKTSTFERFSGFILDRPGAVRDQRTQSIFNRGGFKL